jgi:hypothetical protein
VNGGVVGCFKGQPLVLFPFFLIMLLGHASVMQIKKLSERKGGSFRFMLIEVINHIRNLSKVMQVGQTPEENYKCEYYGCRPHCLAI